MLKDEEQLDKVPVRKSGVAIILYPSDRQTHVPRFPVAEEATSVDDQKPKGTTTIEEIRYSEH